MTFSHLRKLLHNLSHLVSYVHIIYYVNSVLLRSCILKSKNSLIWINSLPSKNTLAGSLIYKTPKISNYTLIQYSKIILDMECLRKWNSSDLISPNILTPQILFNYLFKESKSDFFSPLFLIHIFFLCALFGGDLIIITFFFLLLILCHLTSYKIRNIIHCCVYSSIYCV